MSTKENHVLQPVETHGTHGLLLDVGQLLLQLLHVAHHAGVGVPGAIVHDGLVASTDVVDGLPCHWTHGTMTMRERGT